MRPSGIFLSVTFGVVTMAVTIPVVSGAEPPSKLLEELAADAYPDRVEAERKLRDWALSGGAEAEKSLYRLYRNSENPEIRRRSLSVLREVVIKALTDQRPGFVGIGMGSVKLPPEVAEGGYGIEVQAINPDTPAEKADLRVTDVIMKLDGKGWSQPEAQHEFANRIGEKRGGDKVKLEVLRGGETLEIELILASRPWSAGTYNQTLQLRGANRFIMPGQFPLNEKDAEEQAFKDWLGKQRAEMPSP